MIRWFFSLFTKKVEESDLKQTTAEETPWKPQKPIFIHYVGNATWVDENGIPEDIQVRYRAEKESHSLDKDERTILVEGVKKRLWTRREVWSRGIRKTFTKWVSISPRNIYRYSLDIRDAPKDNLPTVIEDADGHERAF